MKFAFIHMLYIISVPVISFVLIAFMFVLNFCVAFHLSKGAIAGSFVFTLVFATRLNFICGSDVLLIIHTCLANLLGLTGITTLSLILYADSFSGGYGGTNTANGSIPGLTGTSYGVSQSAEAPEGYQPPSN